MKRMAFVGDVHLDRGDPALAEFLELLDRLAASCERIVLMGDLFNLWLGRPELEQPHHRAVVERLGTLRRQGTCVAYIEGNRDYRIADHHVGSTFDVSTSSGISESFGGHRIYIVHGDLANRADRQYRTWHRVSRSWPVWTLFNALPRGRRARWAGQLEMRMRSTNLAHKQVFPEEEIRRYAGKFFDTGHDLVVLGHFHVERDIPCERGRILVLPEWKGSRRHLEIQADGRFGFVDS